MDQFEYTPDVDVKIHEAGAIKQICTGFLSHEDGLPEWLKNSADAYAREDASKSKRVILVFFNYGRKNVLPSISCLDFGGMTIKIILDHFRHWADPDAAKQSGTITTVQGGHGNGGKCYMTHMFQDYSFLYTVKQDKGNIYGVKGGQVRFGFPKNGRDFPVDNLKQELEKIFSSLRCPLLNLPAEISNAFETADGFTLVQGIGPKGYDNKIPIRHLTANLEEHPQMMRTLELCSVYIFGNGKLYKNLNLPLIVPIDGEQPRVIQIPQNLIDPGSGEQVSTTNSDTLPPGHITLFSSAKSMRYKNKGRHNIIYKTKEGFIGYVSILELDIQSPWRDYIYGECYLESLEQYKQNERARLANSPLTRAVEHFITEQIQMLAMEFEDRERRKYSQKEKDELSKMNEALDRWKNKILDEVVRGMWGQDGTGEGQSQARLPSGKPSKIEISLSHQKSGVGVSFRPGLKFFDNIGQRIRQAPFRWISEDNNVAMVDEDLMVINTYSPGQTYIYAETIDGKIKSNKVPLDVVHIRNIRIEPKTVEIAVGSQNKFEAICDLGSGEQSSDVYLEWTEGNPNIARVSSAGLVFGFEVGETEITAGDDNCDAEEPATVKVIVGREKGTGEERGKGYAKVLISEVDRDPQTGEHVSFPSDDPPIQQRPIDYTRKIWWINSAAPLARMYLDTEQGYGFKTREWRMYHLERYLDVMVQIALMHGPDVKESIPVQDWIVRWGEQVSEIQTYAASTLSEFIKTGRLPEE